MLNEMYFASVGSWMWIKTEGNEYLALRTNVRKNKEIEK